MIVYFSGTGNSRFAAEFLAKQLGDDLLDAGLKIKAGETGTLHSDAPWVFVSPVYAWQMPRILRDYISAVTLTGNQNAYFVLTCGSDISNAGEYAAQLCEEKGLCYQGVLKVVMPENYIAMFHAPGEKEARAIVARAKPVLRQGGEWIRQDIPFPVPKVDRGARLKSGPINEKFYRHYVKADAFFSTDACTGCGFCVEVCPLNNIRLEAGKPVWGKRCTHCMACICGCPAETIEYGKRSLGKPRYQCPKDEEL